MIWLLAIAAPLALLGLIDTDDDGPEVTETSGTDGEDTLTGSGANDLLRGFEGDDELVGADGEDTLLGFEGDDLLLGNDGNDMLCAGEGDDFISGNQGFDIIEGQGGNDWAEGGYSNDTLMGNEGEDTVIGGRGEDLVRGNQGDDVVYGGIIRGVPLEADEMRDLASGESLADVLEPSGLEIDLREDDRMDRLEGGFGNDQIFIGNTDIATGSTGNDTFNLMYDDDNSQTPLAEITDFNQDEDNITIVFDAPLNVDDVTVEDRDGDAIIIANGEELATVTGAAGNVSADDITLLTEDSIVGLFDPNAVAATPAT